MVADPRPDDLAWLAFGYVSGDLSADEASAFERRLEEDQAAREAVGEAVELIGAVTLQVPATLPMPIPVVPRSRRPVRHALGWMAAGAAACLALMTGLRDAIPSRPEADGPEGRGPVESRAEALTAVEPNGRVALTWSDLRREAKDDADWAGGMATWLDEPANPAEGESTSASTFDEVDEPPAWLLEAASIRADSDPSSTMNGGF